MTDLVKTNVPGIFKDKSSGAFINTNEYIKPTKKHEKDKEMRILKNEVGSLKNEIKDIKNLLIQLVNGKN